MSPESQDAKIARLEEQVKAAESQIKAAEARADDDRRFIQPLAPMVAGHTIRLDDMTADIREIKELSRHLDANCAKATDLESLRKSIEDKSALRRQMSMARFTAMLALIGVTLTAVAYVVAAIISAGGP